MLERARQQQEQIPLLVQFLADYDSFSPTINRDTKYLYALVFVNLLAIAASLLGFVALLYQSTPASVLVVVVVACALMAVVATAVAVRVWFTGR